MNTYPGDQAALADLPFFQVTLQNLRYFQHGRSCTLWLEPEAPELLRLQQQLQAAFPECNDLSVDHSRGITGFTPHLSLGQWKNAAEVEQAVQEYQASWQALTFTVDSVSLISRQGYNDPFRIRYSIPLGSPAPANGASPAATNGNRPAPQEVNVPYVATVGEAPSTEEHGQLARRYGIGAAQEGVWNFAFGANISPNKLENVRGITPLESVAGHLPGWALRFNHRGAMGNIMPLREGEEDPSGTGGVHGVLHRLHNEDFATLTNMEHEYWPLEIEVQRYGGQPPVRAVAFVSPPDRLIADGLPPPDRYLKLLQAGATEWELDAAYTAWLHGLASVGAEEILDGSVADSEGRNYLILQVCRTSRGSQPWRAFTASTPLSPPLDVKNGPGHEERAACRHCRLAYDTSLRSIMQSGTCPTTMTEATAQPAW
ncbi:hypothetical protein WJX72_010266 [[Myrmecia] bisecta]|uniref:2'-5' RNA ligase family protein n=1 Tax=[Myrmecia] bisecta TaxID=41462 RepID=A0AAW1QSF1_9CHLO